MPPVVRKARAAFALFMTIALLLAMGWAGQPAQATMVSEAGATAGLASAASAPSVRLQADTTASERRLPEGHLVFERFGLDQGLSQSVVTSAVQDSRGFLWFGTQDGLNRFDGYEFVVYENKPEDPNSLSANFIQDLVADPSGVLWIGTNGGGLDSLDLDTGQFSHYQHDPKDPDSLSDNTILDLYADPGGVLWIGTDGGGLDRFDPRGELEPGAARFVHYRNDPSNPHSLSSNSVQSIYRDREGVLWVGTDGGGLNRLDPGSEQGPGAARFVHYQHDPEDPASLGHNTVQVIHEDGDGVLWIGTNGGGLNRLDRETGGFVRFQHDPDDPHSLSNDLVWVIHEDRQGELWIGTFGGGLDRYDPDSGRFWHYKNNPRDPDSLSNDQIWSLYEDPAGALWIGTFGGGVNRFDRDKKFAHYKADPDDPNSLSENVVWAILEDRAGALWIGTNGGGLNRYDPTLDAFVHFRNDPADPGSLSNDVVWSLLEDREGVLWVGTHGGLDRFDPATGQAVHHPSPPVFTIYQDREGVLWIGTWGGGLGQLDPETEKLIFYQNDPADPHSLSDDSVISILEDRAGVLWVGTFDGGLDRLVQGEDEGSHLAKGRFEHYQHDPSDPQSLSHNTVLDIHEDSEGILWLATGGGGLNKLDPSTMSFRHYREKDGLPNDTVYGILEDDIPPGEGGPSLWLSTNRGITKFNPQAETFKNYDVGDGLQSNEFNQGSHHKGLDGEMLFGGVNGFNAFYPEQVTDNATFPPIVLTSLTQGGEEVAAGAATESLTEVRLQWPRNFFEFEFAALDYTQPEENQYAYMLEGFDSDWIEAGTRRFGRYTNLPGGTYTLRLKGSNNDGIWNEGGHSVEVTVVPPVWETWWLRGIVVLLLLGGAFAMYRLRVRSVEARSRELETLVEARTQDLAALTAVTAAVSRSLDLQETLDHALDSTLQATETEGGGV
ncbi:MAG TPA: two-component regulator propeller domain-containing protein, partial [Anaerolineae bacterium]|nr:two-component regulator propeller domain-containing protein [Anaerolineae bacterium]